MPKKKIEGVNNDNFIGIFARNAKNTIVEIETEIKRICMFVKKGEFSASPWAETKGIVRTKIVIVIKYLITLFFILTTLTCFAILKSPLSFINTNATTAT